MNGQTAAMQVQALHRYPLKSAQGGSVARLVVGSNGIEGDRTHALVTPDGATVLSAKRYRRLLEVEVADGVLRWPDTPDAWTLPDAGEIDAALDAALSTWLGVEAGIRAADRGTAVAYEMTFDPPDDDAEYVSIDAPPGSFVDLAAVHLVARQTLDGCAAARPDLDWDVRRFRPNVVVDAPGLAPFGEDAWVGRRIRVGNAVLHADQATVRCAMPLREQPGLDRQPDLYAAMEELHGNHVGLYLSVVEPGEVAVGDAVTLLD